MVFRLFYRGSDLLSVERISLRRQAATHVSMRAMRLSMEISKPVKRASEGFGAT